MVSFKKAVDELTKHALSEIARKYDSGDSRRPYHNTTHTLHVIGDVNTLGRLAKLHSAENQLLQVAAAFHDVVHNGDDDPTNERKSADYAVKCMKGYPVFSKAHIKVVQKAILATKCIQKYPKITQSPGKDYMSQLVCDADLASFGKPFDEFYESAMYYFEELYGAGHESTDQYAKYIQAEIVLLGNHEFWTNEANTLFPNIATNIVNLRKL